MSEQWRPEKGDQIFKVMGGGEREEGIVNPEFYASKYTLQE
jgi:hypothetical protein